MNKYSTAVILASTVAFNALAVQGVSLAANSNEEDKDKDKVEFLTKKLTECGDGFQTYELYQALTDNDSSLMDGLDIKGILASDEVSSYSAGCCHSNCHTNCHGSRSWR